MKMLQLSDNKYTVPPNIVSGHSIPILRTSFLLPLLLAAACTTVKDDRTLARLDQSSIPITDEEVAGSLDKAMESYRKYIQQAPASTMTPEAIRRLADLEVEKSYDIPGLGAPSEPGARPAITHYTRLLTNYPMYDHNDRVLYQLSRAYKEAGESKKAAATLQELARRYPNFEHIDEVNFRLGEYYFSDKKYKQANQAYTAVLALGQENVYYPVALNKLGWTNFRQDNYQQALTYFMTLLDHTVDKNNITSKTGNRIENKQVADTYRAISLCFSYIGGADAITEYIKKNETRLHEAELYKHLAEYYLSKKRYTDTANTYQAFINAHPFSEISPKYTIRIIESYQKGGFTNLAISTRKQFAKNYDPRTDYWKKLKPEDHPAIIKFQKSNIHALASHYHAHYKKPRNQKDKHDNYTQAIHWYREYFYLYPLDDKTPAMGKQLAELFLENNDYRSAALAFERTAYNYPSSEITQDSGYAAIFAYRENLKTVPASERSIALEEITKSSLRFVDHFPQHTEASAVLTAAANDLLILKNYALAANAARRVLSVYTNTEKTQTRSAWLVLADATFESGHYVEAEKAYSHVLAMTDKRDKKRPALIENLAASIYKQGEQAKTRDQHNIAAQHFLRISNAAPTAAIRDTAQYDAAVALVAIEDWPHAARVLEDFLKRNPTHKLAGVTSRNLAVIHRKNNELVKSAAEFERIEKDNKNKATRRDALLQAAELYLQAKKSADALRVYKRYVRLFPSPIEDAIESYQHIADIYESNNDNRNQFNYLNEIIAADEKANKERTYRTRYLAAQALLVLAQAQMNDFEKVTLTKPFKKKLELKKKYMSTAIKMFTRLLEYQVSEITTAATFYIAEIYLQFSHALNSSERPAGLNALEMEQYELALEEQVYLFEEKAINVHKKNTELMDAGIYDPWIEKSIARLTELLPARYAKQEQNSGYLKSLFAQDDRS